MRETHSRVLLGAEMLLALLPVSLALTMAVPAAVVLIPVGLFGLGMTVVTGGPRLLADLWTGSGVLLMGLLGACTALAVVCFAVLAVTFVAEGRAKLRQRPRLLRIAVFSALPPLLLSCLPRVVAALGELPDLDRTLAGLVYSGALLLLPAAHLLLEAWRPPAR